MDDYPKSLAEFERRFASEEDCRAYLTSLRWPDGPTCLRCGQPKVWPTKRDLMVCAECGYQMSVTAGTIFEGTHKPLSLWFRAMWYVTSQKTGASALGVQRVLGLSTYYTAWTWLHKLRRAMVRPGRDRLCGTVEVDETYIGGAKPGKRGRGAEGKSLVMIATEVEATRIGRIRLVRIDDGSTQSLKPAIEQTVSPESVVHTDDWKGYRFLSSGAYLHEIIRPSEELGDNLLPHCHRVASLLKRWMLGTHQGAIAPEHLEYYLDEFTFRFNRRTSRHRGKLFYRLVQQAAAIEPTTYKDMVKHVRGRKPQIHNP